MYPGIQREVRVSLVRPLGHLPPRALEMPAFSAPVGPISGSASLLLQLIFLCLWLLVHPCTYDLPSLCCESWSPSPLFCLCSRQALLLGLRRCGLWAELKALHAQSQELEEAAGWRQLLLQELQAKQQRILHWRRLVVRRDSERSGWAWWRGSMRLGAL